MRHPVCIHADTPYNDPAIACGRPAFLRAHGYLCFGHYNAEQASIPAKPRKSQPRYRAPINYHLNDDQVIADIIKTDARAISAGKVVTKFFGVLNPTALRYLDPPTVH